MTFATRIRFASILRRLKPESGFGLHCKARRGTKAARAFLVFMVASIVPPDCVGRLPVARIAEKAKTNAFASVKQTASAPEDGEEPALPRRDGRLPGVAQSTGIR